MNTTFEPEPITLDDPEFMADLYYKYGEDLNSAAWDLLNTYRSRCVRLIRGARELLEDAPTMIDDDDRETDAEYLRNYIQARENEFSVQNNLQGWDVPEDQAEETAYRRGFRGGFLAAIKEFSPPDVGVKK